MKQFLYHIALIAAGCCAFSYTLLEARDIELKNNSPYNVIIKLFFKLGPGPDQRTLGSFKSEKMDVGLKLIRRVDVLYAASGKLVRDGKDVPGGGNVGLMKIEYNGDKNDIIFNSE
jgi:hypothetical protein